MEQVIYAKFSRERKKEYSIVTKIINGEMGRRVEKSALTKEAVSHIEKMCSNMDKLKKYYLHEEVAVTPCTMRDKCTLEISYIEGVRYDKYFSEIINNGDMSIIKKELIRLKDMLYRVATVEAFVATEKFKQVFGQSQYVSLEGKDSYTISNVDMIFANMIIKDDKIYITDYEWVFEFLVPIDFVLYRSLLLNNSFSMLNESKRKEILSFLNISDEARVCYEKMEDALQLFVSGKNFFSEYKKHSKKRTMRLGAVSPKTVSNFAQVTEEDKQGDLLSQCTIQYKDELDVKETFSLGAERVKLQFDVDCAVFKLKECYAINKNGEKIVLSVRHNASFVLNDDYYFDNDCPSFEFDNDDYVSYGIKIQVYFENSSIIGDYIKKTIECEQKCQELASAEVTIENMKNTKIWKVYSKLRGIH